MSKLFPTVYHCNFCMAESQDPVRWLRVVSLPALIYGNTKPMDLEELTEQADVHACEACGKTIHLVLTRLGIPHEYDPIPVEREPWEWGRILVR